MMKQFLIWLFQDFLYKLYDLAESKFTLQFDALNALPLDGGLLPIGQVGVPYISDDLTAFADPPETLPLPWRPLKFAITSGSLPPGLTFNYTSPLGLIGTPPPAVPGLNLINVVGVPTLAGDFLFSLKWTTSEEIPQNVTRNYRIRIEANQQTNLVEVVESPFSCAIPPPIPPVKKKIKFLGTYPVVCCYPRIHPITGKITPCPDRMRTKDGFYYDKISEDPITGRCCYVRNDYIVKN